MQRCLVAAATNVALVVAASADPAAPDVDPVHGQREDSQRLAQQHRELLTAPPPSPVTPLPAPDPIVDTKRSQRIAGWVVLSAGILVGSAGVAGVLDSSVPGEDSRSSTTPTLLVVGGAATAIFGGLLVYGSRSVRAAPTVGSHAIGLSISGRL